MSLVDVMEEEERGENKPFIYLKMITKTAFPRLTCLEICCDLVGYTATPQNWNSPLMGMRVILALYCRDCGDPFIRVDSVHRYRHFFMALNPVPQTLLCSFVPLLFVS